jgi:hypothetical protein
MSLWNIDMDWDDETEHDVEAYDSSIVEQLMADGYSHEQAVYIASTEMEGAPENIRGGIHSRQTYCNILNYDEG